MGTNSSLSAIKFFDKNIFDSEANYVNYLTESAGMTYFLNLDNYNILKKFVIYIKIINLFYSLIKWVVYFGSNSLLYQLFEIY